jgi:hypothetical protein
MMGIGLFDNSDRPRAPETLRDWYEQTLFKLEKKGVELPADLKKELNPLEPGIGTKE